MNSGQISIAITEVQAVGDTILTTLQAVDPGLAVPAATAEVILNLLTKYAQTAITAYHSAAGIPITVASIQALLPNQTPLSDPAA